MRRDLNFVSILNCKFGKFCKFGNFHENFISSENIKRHVCNVKILGLEHDLPTSVIGRVISPFCEGFIFFKTFTNFSEFTDS